MSQLRVLSSGVLAAFLVTVSPVVEAQVNRVFVSARSGSDANACGNVVTPCQTFQGAVNQVAAGGAVLVLDTGGYGPITIGKAVTIEAPTGIEAFIHPPSGSAITITAGGGDVVVLRGLTLSVGSLYGIDFISGAALHVERCVIQGFESGIIALRGTGTIASDLYVEDTVVRACSTYGIAVLAIGGLVRATIEGCTLEGNGLIGLSSATDYCTSCVSRTIARDTIAAGNLVGFSVSSYGPGRVADLTLDGCTAASNRVAGMQSDSFPGGSALLRYSTSTVTGNGGPSAANWAGVRQSDPAQVFSRRDSTVEGNQVDLYGTIGTYTPR